MKKLLLLLLLFPVLAYADPKEQPIFDFTGGLYTNDQPERLADKYSPDCLNVWFDRGTGVVKRQGYINFLASALPEGQAIRRMYEYRTATNSRYIIFNSSWSVYATNTAGIATSILGGQNPVNTDNYSTGLGNLLRDNGATSGYWDGSTYTAYTVSNSTSMVYGKYNCFFQNYWFKAGVTGYQSTLYWSVVNTPGDFGSYGSGALFVGNNDGDIITGLYPSVWGLMIFKRYATYLLTGNTPSNWSVTPLSTNIGSLYQSTIANYQNYPMFLSWRGLELYDGVNFNLVSLPVDNFMRSINQLSVSQQNWTQATAVDWGAGSGVNVDTTSILGTVQLNNLTTSTSYYASQSVVGYSASYPAQVNKYAQEFIPTSSATVYSINTNFSINANINSVGIWNTVGGQPNQVISQTSNFVSGSDNPIPPVNLIAGVTYYLIVNFNVFYGTPSGNLGTNVGGSIYNILPFNSYALWAECDSLGTFLGWDSLGTYQLLGFTLNGVKIGTSETASYTSQYNGATNWLSWGNFNVKDNMPQAGDSINYYALTSTSAYNLSTAKPIPLVNGSAIASSTGPYIQIVSSFTSTYGAVSPTLNQFTVNWYPTTLSEPEAIVYRDGYWLGINALLPSQANITISTSTNLSIGNDSLVNIDSVTYSSSLAISNQSVLALNDTGIGPYQILSSTCETALDQGFSFPGDVILNSFYINGQSQRNLIWESPCYFAILNSTYSIVWMSTDYPSNGWNSLSQSDGFGKQEGAVFLKGGSTYYMEIWYGEYGYPLFSPSSYPDATLTGISISTSTNTTYLVGTITNRGLTPRQFAGRYMDLGFEIQYTSASYTSSILGVNSLWQGWGTFTANSSLPTGTSINYYAITSTSAYNINSNLAIPIISGQSVNSTVGPYINILSSFTVSSGTNTPVSNYWTLNYLSNSGYYTNSVIYKNRQWNNYVAPTNTNVNNIVLHYDKYGRFSLHNDIYMGATCLYYNNLYTGSSDNSGQIYLQDVPNLYSDRGAGYSSYYTTKVYDCGMPGNQKNLHYIYAFAQNAGAWNLYCNYQLNGQSNSWTSMDNVNLSVNSSVVQKCNFLNGSASAYYVQFQFGNNIAGQNFSIRGLDLIYDPYPIQ